MAEWVANDFPMGLYDLYFLPFAKSSLNAPDVLSAGELMQFFHFYFFGNPEGLAFNGTCQDMGPQPGGSPSWKPINPQLTGGR